MTDKGVPRDAGSVNVLDHILISFHRVWLSVSLPANLPNLPGLSAGQKSQARGRKQLQHKHAIVQLCGSAMPSASAIVLVSSNLPQGIMGALHVIMQQASIGLA